MKKKVAEARLRPRRELRRAGLGWNCPVAGRGGVRVEIRLVGPASSVAASATMTSGLERPQHAQSSQLIRRERAASHTACQHPAQAASDSRRVTGVSSGPCNNRNYLLVVVVLLPLQSISQSTCHDPATSHHRHCALPP
ncbi:hypothetical protein K491DRAFT_273097 [Lophiostoma macrostomum CBS 122681]|uniref:Uncharacterized protein n=1 Tax=Lophiostoma macrostomum CBS 122681 TaxID=1314788 RepID=A0A6A6SJ96_9PLEO|nr:hypothetical protein K491DRAFT_273097 [Lophiostoma macrostomum CBS 122681]